MGSDCDNQQIRKRIGNQNFHIKFCCRRKIGMPRPVTNAGKILIEEILKSITQEQYQSEETHQEKYHEPLIPIHGCHLIDSQFIRNSYPSLSIYYSLTGPVTGGVSYGLTDEDYKDIKEIILKKLQKDYASSKKCKIFLLLYSFESARHDKSRLINMLDELVNASPYRFSEVWYMRPYPNNLDYISLVYKEQE